MNLQTEFDFKLPRGYLDVDGRIYQDGCMRLATALDEIEAFQDPRVQENEAYLPLVLFSRVITRLGPFVGISPQVISGFFASDLAYLEDLYLRLNSPGEMVLGAVCPQCSLHFQLRVAPLGEA